MFQRGLALGFPQLIAKPSFGLPLIIPSEFFTFCCHCLGRTGHYPSCPFVWDCWTLPVTGPLSEQLKPALSLSEHFWCDPFDACYLTILYTLDTSDLSLHEAAWRKNLHGILGSDFLLQLNLFVGSLLLVCRNRFLALFWNITNSSHTICAINHFPGFIPIVVFFWMSFGMFLLLLNNANCHNCIVIIMWTTYSTWAI